jgi:glycosyltransferase involved in cell wall biosynthesis
MKFSIGIPAFKLIYLKECIDSVLSQTISDYELIIVNDASPENIDNVIELCNSSQIRYYKNEKNFGSVNVVDNWNKCLSYATGEYFILMGDDDKMSPNYLQEFSSLIEKFPSCDIYHCRTIIINERSIPISLSEPRPEFESVYDSILQRMKGNRLFFISDYVFRTQTLKNNGGFFKLPLAWASDDITSYIASKKNGIAHTNEPVFFYRQHAQTISNTGNIYYKMDAILDEEKWLSSFVEKNIEGFTDNLLKRNIKLELKIFIQKKKIRTIYSANDSNIFSFLKWFLVRKKFQLSTRELLYAGLMKFKEKRKARYEL